MKLKRELAAIAAFVLAVSLTGCGAEKAPAPTTPATTAPAVTETTAATEAPTEAPTEAATEAAPAEIDTTGAVLTFSGEKLTAVCFRDFTAKLYDTASGECKLETTFSYTRTKTAGAGGMSGYTFGDDEIEGPVIYLHYPDVTRDDGINACARSVLTADGMTLTFDGSGLSDTFQIPEDVWSVLNSGEKILTFVGFNTPYEFDVEFYEGGLCSAYALRDGAVDEITPGRYSGKADVPYGGGEDANKFDTGFWTLEEDPSGIIEVDGTTYTLTVNWDGIVITGDLTPDGSLSVRTDFAMSSYKKSANNTASRASWQQALLGIAAEKVAFEGIDHAVICMDDAEQSAKVVNIDDKDEIFATGTWAFDDVGMTITVTLEDGTVMVSVPGEDGRINITYGEDECESGVNWKDYFVSAVEVVAGNAEEYSVDATPALAESPLTGKTIFFLGSSVTFGEKSEGEAMGEFIAKRNSCTAIKEAVSGTTLAQVNNSIHQNDSYVDRLNSYLASDACVDALDAFVCQLSTNDVGGRCQPGEITAADVKSADAFDRSTTYGAMEYIIATVQEKWNCPIVFYSNSHFDSNDYASLIEAAKAMAEKWGNITVIDLYNDEQFNAISAEDLALYMADAKHPTKAGYREWWLPAFETALNGLFK